MANPLRTMRMLLAFGAGAHSDPPGAIEAIRGEMRYD
jgi:hypothetical protein